MTNRNRPERLQTAFDFVAQLIGRDWVPLLEIAEAMERSYRTVLRYALAAEVAGIAEYRPGSNNPRCAEDRSVVRLVSSRLRRSA